MKFGSSRSALYDAQKVAQARWELAQAVWHDEAQQHFTEVVWQPLDQMTTDVLRAVDQLGVLFTQVRQECSYDESNDDAYEPNRPTGK